MGVGGCGWHKKEIIKTVKYYWSEKNSLFFIYYKLSISFTGPTPFLSIRAYGQTAGHMDRQHGLWTDSRAYGQTV